MAQLQAAPHVQHLGGRPGLPEVRAASTCASCTPYGRPCGQDSRRCCVFAPNGCRPGDFHATLGCDVAAVGVKLCG